jgi:signal transduction histidine kinase
MAAAYGVINNHGGWIDVDSRLNQGTVVRIYLPITQSRRSREPNDKWVG